MTLTKKQLRNIAQRYPTLLVVDDDITQAFEFVSDVLRAEAQETERQFPYAHSAVTRLTAAEYEVYSLTGDIENMDNILSRPDSKCTGSPGYIEEE